MFAVHEVSSLLLDVGLELVESVDPSSPAGLHVTVLLHGNDSEVIFFVDPDLETINGDREKTGDYQEVLVVIVPDTSGIGPVSSHTSGGEEGRNGLVEEEVIGDELLLGGVGHFVEREILALEKG